MPTTSTTFHVSTCSAIQEKPGVLRRTQPGRGPCNAHRDALLTPRLRDQALLFLGEIRDHLTLVTLTEREYFRVVEAAAVAVLAGGAVYDASLGQCPVKADAEAICTWNTSDSLRAARADTCTVTTADRV